MDINKAPRKIRLKDVGVNEYCSAHWPPTKTCTFLRPGIGSDGVVPLFDSAGCPILCRHKNTKVYPVPSKVGYELFVADRSNK